MPRWTSILTAAAAAIVALPVGSHYVSPRDPNQAAVAAVTSQEPPSRSGGHIVRAADKKDAAESMLEKLHKGQKDAQMEGREAIAGLMCEYTHAGASVSSRPVVPHARNAKKTQENKDSSYCSPESIKDATVIIATVPDPVHTHLALRFDREIDTIEDSLQQLGWIYDRSWLPWESTTHKAPDSREARTLDNAAQDALESLPGVLLFRKRTEDALSPTLIVLLVGEKPTSGINSEQFKQAMRYWEDPKTLVQSAADGKSSPKSLVILGPTFSGSLDSLNSVLHNRFESPGSASCKQGLRIIVSSGTVSNGEALRKLEDVKGCASVKVLSESFLPDGNTRDKQLLTFLQGHQPGVQIAKVSEKESTFGAGEISKKDSTGEAGRASNSPFVTFSFPREVSQLRKAYEKNGVLGFSEASNAPHTQLQLSTAEDEHEGDSVENFAGPLGVVALEQQMASLAHALAANHVSIVLLSATDVMDEMFVARYLVQHAPDISVIIEDSDQLFLHAGPDAALNNVYVASPWPLTEENEVWTRTQAQLPHDTFESGADQGISTALRHAICLNGDLTSAKNCGAEMYREYLSPLAGQIPGEPQWWPPLWLSVVEHGRFQPIALVPVAEPATGNLSALYNSGENAGTQDHVARNRQPNMANGIIFDRTNLSMSLLATGMIGLLLWHGWACYWSRLDRSFAWPYALAEKRHYWIRLLTKALLSLLGAFALAFLYFQDSSGFRVETEWFRRYLVAGEVIGILVSGLSIWRLARSLDLDVPKRWASAFVWCVFWAVTVWWANGELWPLLAHTPDRSHSLLLLYRASLPFSGASPALPVLLSLAAMAALLHSLFGRLAFFGHRIPLLPDGYDQLRCPSNQCVAPLTSLLSIAPPRLQSEGAKRRRVYVNAWRWGTTVACLAAMLFFLVLSSTHRIVSLEHSRVDYVVTVCAVIVAAAMLQTLTMAALAWRLLQHRVLIPLKQSPLRWGFTWIKGYDWRRIWRSSKNLSSNRVFDYLLRMLQLSSRTPASGIGRQYYSSISELYKKVTSETPDVFTSGMVDLHKEMKRLAEDKLRCLQREWITDRGPLTGTETIRGIPLLYEIKDMDKDRREDMLRRMGDEEFVALLYVGYISMVLIQIRQRIVTASVLYVLLLWAMSCYPWMYRHTILLGMVALFAVLAAVTLAIYTEMFRDDILSRTTESTSGKLDGGFFAKIIPVLGIPLLTLVASQFPEVSNFVFSWVEPSLSKFQ